MQSILRGLFNGTILPCERLDPPGKGYFETLSKIEDEQRYIGQKVSPDDRERLEELTWLYAKLGSMEQEDAFALGFSLGLLVALDVRKQAEQLEEA